MAAVDVKLRYVDRHSVWLESGAVLSKESVVPMASYSLKCALNKQLSLYNGVM